MFTFFCEWSMCGGFVGSSKVICLLANNKSKQSLTNFQKPNNPGKQAQLKSTPLVEMLIPMLT